LEDIEGKHSQEDIKSARLLNGDCQKSELIKILMKSKLVLEAYKKKEIQWTKEKKELISVIERLKREKNSN
jgi:hypothetical protein